MTQRRRAPVLLSVALAALPAALSAQDMGPPAELKKLAPLVGTWKTSGTMVMAPDQPEITWTSDSSYEWVLGGHFLRADTRIDFAGESMGPFQAISFMGWDREHKRYVSWEVASMGWIATAEIHWAGDGTMVQTMASVEEGQPTIERWITRLDGERMSFVGHRAVGTGDFTLHVSGTGTRTSEQASKIEFVDASFMGDAAEAKMTRFEKTAGTYEVKGWMTAMPGTPKAEITGTDRREMMFGGTVLAGHIHGNAIAGMPPYEGFDFIAWDAVAGCYKALGLSNYGEAYVQEARWDGNHLVLTGAMLQMGQPVVSRGLLAVDDSGALTGTSAHSIVGTAAPSQVFEASYRKKDS